MSDHTRIAPLNIVTHTKTLRHGMDKCYFKIVYRPGQLNCLRYIKITECNDACIHFHFVDFYRSGFVITRRKTDLAGSLFSSLFIILSCITLNIYFAIRRRAQMYFITISCNR